MPFPAATGHGVRVAVIDSGVNAAHPHICARTETVLVRSPGNPDLGSDLGSHDALGHGTAVAAAIQEKAPAAEYFAVKLFSSSLRATTQRLLEAIEWAIDNRMDVVNLSLGTANMDDWAKIQASVERASAQGIVLVSARSAGVRPLLPGALHNVIGVDVDWDLPRHRYRTATADGRWYFFASGYPRPLAGISQAKNLSGISFAVANMTGFAIRACEGLQDRSFHTVREALAAEIHKLQRTKEGGQHAFTQSESAARRPMRRSGALTGTADNSGVVGKSKSIHASNQNSRGSNSGYNKCI